MVDNNPDDILRKLKTLSKQEARVLVLRCQGMKYVDIGKALSIAVPTVKTDMGRIYLKLGLDVLEPSQRLKELYETVCPLLKEPKSAGGKEEPKSEDVVEGEFVPDADEQPVPDRIMDMVDKDEKAVVLWQPAPLAAPPPKPRGRRIWPRILALVIVLCLCLSGGAAYLVFGPGKGALVSIFQAASQPSATAIVAAPVSSATSLPPATVPIPTQTAVVVVVTATPPPAAATPTAWPPASSMAAASLPFSDNFDQGPSPSWRILNGNWLTTGGRFTPLGEPTQYDWLWVSLDEPGLQNYRLAVNYDIAYPYAAAQGEVAVAIRITDTQSKYLGFAIDTLTQGGWALIGSDMKDI